LNGTVPPGDVAAPEFTATAHTGDARTRADLLGRRTVMWFYPAAFTGG
jgi:peroxiredoxin